MLSTRRFQKAGPRGRVVPRPGLSVSTHQTWRIQGAMRNRHAVILVAVALLAAAPAFASGFGFYEQSAKASAQGGAWVARADDAAANWYNPAALVHLSGREVQFGTNWLDIGGNTTFTPTDAEIWGGTKDAVGN